MDDLRYPIGKFMHQEGASEAERTAWIDDIEQTPARVRAAVNGLSDAQLETRYRPGGWTVRQVVHHLADSHINAYVRFRLAMTEESPLIKTYMEDRWAELIDARTAPLEPSLHLLEGLHSRWVSLLRSLTPEDLRRTIRHPELGMVALEKYVAMYAWHGRHHLAHIRGAMTRAAGA